MNMERELTRGEDKPKRGRNRHPRQRHNSEFNASSVSRGACLKKSFSLNEALTRDDSSTVSGGLREKSKVQRIYAHQSRSLQPERSADVLLDVRSHKFRSLALLYLGYQKRRRQR